MSLQGKVALITGSSKGIGAGTAIAFAKEGADLVVNYVSESSAKLAQAVAQEAKAHGVQVLVVRANIASLEEIDSLVKQTVDRFGRIDILVNNSAVLSLETVGTITKESYTKLMDVNLRGPIFLSQAAVPYMGKDARIINVSSVAARIPNPAMMVYSATKAALEAVTRNLALELREKGIQVTSVSPGPVATETVLSLPGELVAKIRESSPMAEVDDIADTIVFLAGPKSRWITGATLSVNNGALLN